MKHKTFLIEAYCFEFIQLQITIELKAEIGNKLKTLLEAKLLKGQQPVFINRFVIYQYFKLCNLLLVKSFNNLYSLS